MNYNYTRQQEARSWNAAIRKREHPDVWGSHGVGRHPPDDCLRWNETPLAEVRLTSLSLPLVW